MGRELSQSPLNSLYGSDTKKFHIHLVFSGGQNPDFVQGGVTAVKRRIACQTWDVPSVTVEDCGRCRNSLNRDMPELETRGFLDLVLLLAGDELRDGPRFIHSFAMLFLLSRLYLAPAIPVGRS